jgi:glycosyltransferase involved in cell wall biosynthesis
MKIHLFDDDPRQQTDPINYPTNHGPFSHISIELNKALKRLGEYSEPDDADFVGFNSGLNLGFRYKHKRTFVINVWETINALPFTLIEMARYQRIFGLSQQITDLWNKYEIPCKTVYPGCDTDFWHQTGEKDKTFTFLHVNSSNVRSGLDLTLEAFFQAFRGNKDVKLIVKDTNESERLNQRIKEYVSLGTNIEYISKRMHNYEIRALYSRSHVCLNLLRITSFGLPLLESSACNCLCVTGDTAPTNEIIKPESGVLIKPSKKIPLYPKIVELQSDWGLLNCFPPLRYPEEPLFYDFDVNDYATTLLNIYNNWNVYSKIDTRTPIVNDWTWDKSAKTLISYL